MNSCLSMCICILNGHHWTLYFGDIPSYAVFIVKFERISPTIEKTVTSTNMTWDNDTKKVAKRHKTESNHEMKVPPQRI